MKKLVNLFLILLFTGTFNPSIVLSDETYELAKCLKVVSIKTKKKMGIPSFGILREESVIVELQNSCKFGISGSFLLHFLDKDGFLVNEEIQSFQIIRKGLARVSFISMFSPARSFKKVKSKEIKYHYLEKLE